MAYIKRWRFGRIVSAAFGRTAMSSTSISGGTTASYVFGIHQLGSGYATTKKRTTH